MRLSGYAMGWQPDGPTRSAASGARSERLRRAKVRASALPVANPATGMAWHGVAWRVTAVTAGGRQGSALRAWIPGAGSDEAPPRPRSVIEPGRRRPRAPTARGHRFFPPRRSGPGWRQAPARDRPLAGQSSRPTRPPAALPSGRRPRRVYSPPVGSRAPSFANARADRLATWRCDPPGWTSCPTTRLSWQVVTNR